MLHSLLVLVFMGITANAEVHEGKIARFNPELGSETLQPEYCGNAEGENWHCSSMSLQQVQLEKADGSRIAVAKLLLPGSSYGGLMGMGPSDASLFLGLALSPKENWQGFEEFVEAVEMSPVRFVLAPESRFTSGISNEPAALAKLSLTITLTEKAAELSMKEPVDKNSPEYQLLKNERKMQLHIGEHLNLEKISSELSGR